MTARHTVNGGVASEVASRRYAPPMRWTLVALGWLFVVLGLVGIVVPGLPTTVFLVAAAWTFSRSSPRFERWLSEHRTFGPLVEGWRRHRVIPVRAKVVAVCMMAASVAYVALVASPDWRAPAALSAILIPAAVYVCTRQSRPPEASEARLAATPD